MKLTMTPIIVGTVGTVPKGFENIREWEAVEESRPYRQQHC